MKVFKKPNLSNDWKCPICGTAEEKEVVLIGVTGTEAGYNIEAEQIHLDCIDPRYYKEHGMLYQDIREAR